MAYLAARKLLANWRSALIVDGADRLQPVPDLVLAGGAGILDARAVLGLHAAARRQRRGYNRTITIRSFGNLRVYKGPDHPHAAQSPTVLDVAKLNPKNSRSADTNG